MWHTPVSGVRVRVGVRSRGRGTGRSRGRGKGRGRGRGWPKYLHAQMIISRMAGHKRHYSRRCHYPDPSSRSHCII